MSLFPWFFYVSTHMKAVKLLTVAGEHGAQKKQDGGQAGPESWRLLYLVVFLLLILTAIVVPLVLLLARPVWCSTRIPPTPTDAARAGQPNTVRCLAGGCGWSLRPRRRRDRLHLPPARPPQSPTAAVPAVAGARGGGAGWGRQDCCQPSRVTAEEPHPGPAVGDKRRGGPRWPRRGRGLGGGRAVHGHFVSLSACLRLFRVQHVGRLPGPDIS